jgi:hypothetical protein
MATLGSTLFPLDKVAAEADPVAIAALDTAKTELNDAIALKADNADLTAAVTQIETAFNDLDLTKADKTDLDTANKAIADLTAALGRNDATDAELDAALNAANDAIAKLQAVKPVLEVTSVLARTTPTLYWPANFTASNPVGSYLVRAGQVDTVAVTRGNQFWDNTWEEVFSFTRADFSKKLILRIALPAEDTNRSYRVHGQNALGGVLCSLVLSHDGSAWGCQGATVIINRGYAVASFPITLSASSICSFWSSVDAGRCQKIAFYEPGKEVLSETVVSGSEIATKTELAAVDLRLAELLNLEAAPNIKVKAGEGTIFSGNLWVNRSGVEKTLPATTALIVEKWFVDNGFERSVSPVASGAASDIITGTVAVPVVWAAKDLSDGIKSKISTSGAPLPWDASYTYGQNEFAIADGRIWVSVANANLNKPPATDKGTGWKPYNPGNTNSKYIDRDPTVDDIFPAGFVWVNNTYGPNGLLYLSKGSGIWEVQNRITLSKIRITAYGTASSYTVLKAIKILKADGTQYGDIWRAGASSGVNGFPSSGSDYTNQGASPKTNSSGWFELYPRKASEVLAGFGGIIGTFRDVGSTGIQSFELFYDNDFSKVFNIGQLYGGTATVPLSPAQPFPVGKDVLPEVGHNLTLPQAQDATDKTFGRISGEVLNQSWDAIYARQPKPATQHDFGVKVPQPLRSAWAHLEGGAGYELDAADFTDDFTSLVTNTTNGAIAGLTFRDFDGVYLVDGGERIDFVGPLTVPANKRFQVTVTVNGLTKWVNLYPFLTSADIPDPVDLAPLRRRLDDIETDDADDDAVVAALEALVDAIDLTPYAKTADLPAPIDLSPYAKTVDLPAPVDLRPLGDRLTALEANPVSVDEIVISELPPSDGTWKYWSQIIYDWDKWLVSEVQYVQARKGWALERSKADPRPMPAATHATATQISPGNFSNRLQGGATFTYATTRSSSNDSIEFPAGVYTAIQWEYREANGNLIAASARYETIGPTDTAHGMGRDAAPANAATVAIILVKPDNSQIRYRFDLV